MRSVTNNSKSAWCVSRSSDEIVCEITVRRLGLTQNSRKSPVSRLTRKGRVSAWRVAMEQLMLRAEATLKNSGAALFLVRCVRHTLVSALPPFP